MIAALFAFTAFLGSFLLFLVQPMVGKWLLPTFGGAPAVWTTSLVFFQGALLAGYLVAHLGLEHLSWRRQLFLHCVLLGTGLLWLPPLRDGVLPFASPESPASGVFLILGLAVGWSFTMLAAGSPVLQAWYARLAAAGVVPGQPWGLYAAGNAGSLLALVSYPFLIEPAFSLGRQNMIWSGGYLALLLAWLACATFAWRAGAGITSPGSASLEQVGRPTLRQCLRWTLFAAVPSALLNSLTGFITTDLAPLPLLWVVPLALYLLSFVIVFSAAGASLVRLPTALIALMFLPLPYTTESTIHWPLLFTIGHHLLLALGVFILFHGLLVRERPETGHLSRFYLWMAFGGFLGGTASSLGAPLVFSTHHDYALVLMVSSVLLLILPMTSDHSGTLEKNSMKLAVSGMLLLAIGLLFWRYSRLTHETPVSSLIVMGTGPFFVVFGGRRFQRWVPLLCALWMYVNLFVGADIGTTLTIDRNFFGTVRVATMRENNAHILLHGNICHGSQGWSEELRRLPLSYYAPSSSIHQAFSWMQFRHKALRVGVVGLGTGALAGYSRPSDEFVFFEIDPKIVRIAKNPEYFTFLTDCRGQLRLVEADGRLGLRREPGASFDVLVFDAYSSSAIPTHLLTREAVSEYLDKLKPGGILIFHLSNQYLNLRPVLGNIVTVLGLEGWSSYDEPQLFPDHHLTDLRRFLTYGAIWAIVTRPSHPIRGLFDDLAWKPMGFIPTLPLWTDDHTPMGTAYTWR